jgi:hypothetical protein
MAVKVQDTSSAEAHILLAQYEILRRNGDSAAQTAKKTEASNKGWTIQ